MSVLEMITFYNLSLEVETGLPLDRYQIKNTLKKNKRKTFEGILVGSHMFSLFLGGKKAHIIHNVL